MTRADHFVAGAGPARHALSFRHVNDSGEHSVIAEHAGEHVGELMLYDDYGTGAREVNHVGVKEQYRRQGVATALWNEAKQHGLNPFHSDNQTPEGRKWAAKVGD